MTCFFVCIKGLCFLFQKLLQVKSRKTLLKVLRCTTWFSLKAQNSLTHHLFLALCVFIAVDGHFFQNQFCIIYSQNYALDHPVSTLDKDSRTVVIDDHFHCKNSRVLCEKMCTLLWGADLSEMVLPALSIGIYQKLKEFARILFLAEEFFSEEVKCIEKQTRILRTENASIDSPHPTKNNNKNRKN